MKIAIGIISLFLGLLVLLQSCTVGTASHMLGEQATAEAGAIGMLVGILFVFGGAFSFGLPVVSMVVFILAALFALIAATSGSFSDMGVGALIALLLAVGSFFTWRAARKAKVRATDA